MAPIVFGKSNLKWNPAPPLKPIQEKCNALVWEKKYFIRSAKIFNIDHLKNISVICQLHWRNQIRRTFLIKLNNLRVLELHEVWILYEGTRQMMFCGFLRFFKHWCFYRRPNLKLWSSDLMRSCSYSTFYTSRTIPSIGLILFQFWNHQKL